MSNIQVGGGGQVWKNEQAQAPKQAQKAQQKESLSELQKFAQGVAAPFDQLKNSIMDGAESIASRLHIFNDPEAATDMIDDMRASQGNERYQKLVTFQSKLDSMSTSDLKTARNYLQDLIIAPNNKDDEYLGVLLKSVTKELDSRSVNPFGPIRPLPPMPRPMPFDPHVPQPTPVKPWVFDPNMRVD